MSNRSIPLGLNEWFLSWLEQLPVLSRYAKTRGWPFLLSWGHRVAGLLMVFFIFLHIRTASYLSTPAVYDAKMQVFRSPLFAFLEWALAIPVIFHALNGGRLILYESFGNRQDEPAIRWTILLSVIYTAFLGVLMIMGNQEVSAVFFWLAAFVASLTLAFGLISRMRAGPQALSWKLQRITGVFLLVMVPAHLLFMHLNLPVGHEANVVLLRMRNFFIKVVDLLLLLGVLYHGGYGLVSVVSDYLASRGLRAAWTALVVVGMVWLAWVGIRVILFA